jgi:hypothetical protein
MSLVAACMERGVKLHFMQEASSDLYINRNLTLCPTMLKGQDGKPYRAAYPVDAKDWKPYNGTMKPDRVFWIDTDMTFTPADFFRLIDHDVDFVSGCCMTGPNTLALGYYGKLPSGEEYLSNLPWLKQIEGKGTINAFKMWAEDHPDEKGLRKVDYAGLAFACTKLSVYERLEYPYFRTTTLRHGGVEIQTSEDLGFCWRARQAGVEIFADPQVLIGHQKTIELVVTR